MKTKNLYIFTADNGDGSTGISFTMDEEVVSFMQDPENESLMMDMGYIDGDGINPSILTVPEECTYESVGIHFPITKEDIEQWNDARRIMKETYGY